MVCTDSTNVNRPDRVYRLRNDFELYVPPARLSLTQKHPYHSFPSAWREFNEYNIKIQREKNIFNSMLKNTLLINLTVTQAVVIFFVPPVIYPRYLTYLNERAYLPIFSLFNIFLIFLNQKFSIYSLTSFNYVLSVCHSSCPEVPKSPVELPPAP